MQRYAKAAQVGARLWLLDEKRDGIFVSGRATTAGRTAQLMADLANSELRSPLDGVALRIHTREGERPGSDGVIEVGASQAMWELWWRSMSPTSTVSVLVNGRLNGENGGSKAPSTVRSRPSSPGAAAAGFVD